MYPNKCNWLAFSGCSETQHNAGCRSPGGASMFGTASTLWTNHWGSSPWLDGGSSSPERRQVLRQEISSAAWWPPAAAAWGGGGSCGHQRWRWCKVKWRRWHICMDPCWFLIPLWTLQRQPLRVGQTLGAFPTLPDLILNRWATQVRYYFTFLQCVFL